MKKLNRKGFTLVELLVVIAIIGILAVVAVPALFKNINKAKIAKVESDYNAVKSSIVTYYAENNVLVNDIDSLDVDGLSDGKETPIGGVYSIRAKDISNGNQITSIGGRVAAHKIKPNGDIVNSESDGYLEGDELEKVMIVDKDGNQTWYNTTRIYLDNYGDTFLSIQGHLGGKELYINKEQFKKLAKDIGYENIFISSAPEGTNYQTSEIYIRLANNILPKPKISNTTYK